MTTANAEPVAADPRGDTCPNCQETLPDPQPAYCPACGQETALRVPTLADFAKEYGGHLLATEGALWRTMRGLLRPGHLTLAYLAGQRRRYLTPLRLFLSICLLCVGLVHWVRPAHEKPTDQVSFVHAKIGVKDGRFVCESLPAERCVYWQRRISADPELLKDLEQARRSNNQMTRQAVFLAMPPSLALLLLLVYWPRKQAFGLHMVASLHLHSFMLPLITAQVLLARWFPGVAWISGGSLAAVVLAFSAVTLQRIYQGRPWLTGVKLAGVCVAYISVFALWTGLAANWNLQRILM